MDVLGLALDLSAPVGTFALYFPQEPDRPPIERQLPGTFSHSESLIPELKSTLEVHGFYFQQISEWVLGAGPGSFTGLRIAFATLKAFCQAQSTPVFTVSGPEARVHAYLKECASPENTSSVLVLSYLTSDKTLGSYFSLTPMGLSQTSEDLFVGGIQKASKTSVVLTEERIRDTFLTRGAGPVISFPLRARHLCDFKFLKSKKTFALGDLHTLTPLYLGSSHFD